MIYARDPLCSLNDLDSRGERDFTR